MCVVTVIGSNIKALGAIRRLADDSEKQQLASERLSTGLRINGASDDAAGLAISMTLNANSRVYNQAIRNLNDGISMSNIAQGTVGELRGITFRLLELSEQAANGVYSTKQRSALSKEAEALTKEFNRIVATAQFNGVSFFQTGTTSRVRLQAGYGTEESLLLTLGAGLSRLVGTGTYTPGWSTPSTANNQPVTGDLNGDGFDDVVNNQAGGTGNAVQVHLSNGDGTFRAAVLYASPGTNTRNFALGDVNGDERLDLVATDHTNSDIVVYFGNGDGSFQPYSVYDSGGNATGTTLFDINQDGNLDIAFGNGLSQVGVMMNRGNGTFDSMVTYDNYLGSTNILFGDFNGDSIVDMGTSSSNGFYVYSGNSGGTFGTRTFHGTTGNALIGTADLDGNGLLDIVATNFGGGTVSIKLQTSKGVFASEVEYTGADPNDIRSTFLTDYDDDGIKDVVAMSGAGTVSALRGNGDGTFQTRIMSSGFLGYWMGLGDFNGDGVQDVANVNGGFMVGLGNTTTSPFISAPDFSTRKLAAKSLDKVRRTLDRIAAELGNIGSSQSRFQTAIGALQSRREGYIEAESRISSADIAVEAAEAVRTKVLSDYAASVLGYTRSSQEIALRLLQDS